MTKRPKHIIQAERLRVFRFILDFRKQALRDPNPTEVAEGLDIEYQASKHHLIRLDGAKGIGKLHKTPRAQNSLNVNNAEPAPVDHYFHRNNAI